MPVIIVQHVTTWLAGTLCLCLVLGCAGHSQSVIRSSGAEFVGPPIRAEIVRGQSADASEIRAADRGGRNTIQSTADESHEAAVRLSGLNDATKPAVPILEAPGNSCAPSISQSAWVSEVTTGPRLPVISGDSAPISEVFPAPGLPVVQRTLSLREAIDTALIQNPDVVTARAAAPVARAARDVAATYPWNPSVQVGVFPYARNEAGDLLAVKNQVAVMQTVELAHQPQHRQQAADAAWKQEQSKITTAEWGAATNAMRSYFNVLYKKGLLDLARESAKLGEHTAGAMNRRFAAGLATPSERIVVSSAARRSQRRAELAEADYQTALQTLRIVLNMPADEQFAPSSALEAYNWLPIVEALDQAPLGIGGTNRAADAEDAITQIATNRPDVAAARFGVSAAGANLDLARSNRIPNLTAGPSYERDESGTVFVGLQTQMDLPIWNTGCPLVRQRAAELQQQLITWRQAQSRAASEAHAAANRYQLARGLWLELSKVGNVGDNEFNSINDAFAKGQASIMEVLATKENLIQERQAYLDLLNQVSQAAVDVIAALTIDPERLIEAPTDTGSGAAKQK